MVKDQVFLDSALICQVNNQITFLTGNIEGEDLPAVLIDPDLLDSRLERDSCDS